MTARRLRLGILAVAATAVAALLVWAAATGPSGVVGQMHATQSTHHSAPAAVSSPPSATPTPPSAQPPRRAIALSDRHRSSWIGDLLAILVVGGCLWLLVTTLRAVLQGISRDTAERRTVVAVDPLPDPQVAREALQRDRDAHFAALGSGDLRNGIVGCWVLLEQAAAEAGLPRRPSETPTEFVVRFLRGLDVDPRPVARLAGLYHEARFSSHRMADDARPRAEAALAAIHADLVVAGVRPTEVGR